MAATIISFIISFGRNISVLVPHIIQDNGQQMINIL